MKKLLAKKASELLNKTVGYTNEDVAIEPAKWLLGSIKVPQDKNGSK